MKRSLVSLISVVILAGILVWGGTWQLSEWLAGEKPTIPYTTPKPSAPFLEKLTLLAGKIEASPESVELWREYAEALEKALQHTSDKELIAELQHAYASVIKLEPEGALVERERLADVRFTVKDFAKAAELYRSILTIQPDNQKVRGRLASALTFLGEFEPAIDELKAIIAANPESFQGYAYLAITYAQMNKIEEARATGKQAVELAPNEEARQRFEAFLESLSEKTAGSKEPTQNPVDAYLTTNEITRQKFVRSDRQGKQLLLYFKDFPVHAMPPVAKDKFFGTLKEKAAGLALSRIQLIDSATGQTLAEIPVAESTTE